jgi:hypothetical protein
VECLIIITCSLSQAPDPDIQMSSI